MARTDMSMLQALATAAGKLSHAESTAFRRMREDLENGTIVALSRKQREWVTAKYFALKLNHLENKPVTVKPNLRKGPPAWQPPPGIDPFGSMPLRPPHK